MNHLPWKETVARTLGRYVCSRSARIIVRQSFVGEEPSAFLGELYLRILQSKRCLREFPLLPADEIEKRVWTIARFHLLHAVRQQACQDGVRMCDPAKLDSDKVSRKADSNAELCWTSNLAVAVAKLPEPLRSVVEHHLNSKTFTEIAATERVAVGTVSRRFQRAIELLRSAAKLN